MRLSLFYPILDTDTAARRGIDVVAAADRILEAGARMLQLRHKGFFSREMFQQARQIAALCREADALFVCNDRADIARLLGVALHLGQDDLSPSDARRVLGDGAFIGFSTHNEEQLRAAATQPANYLALGPIFGTSSKLNSDPVVGLDNLRRLRALTARPLVAIGGITRLNAPGVIQAGADSVAVIGDLFPEDGNLRGRVEEWLSVLNTQSKLPDRR
jgi:thiamine-phosphate pyrophosphorylase